MAYIQHIKYIYICSTMRGRFKGAARSINAIIIIAANSAIFSCGGNYSTAVSLTQNGQSPATI